MTRLTRTRPDDWHLHLRDDETLTATAQALAYRERKPQTDLETKP